jgi:integrase
MSEELLDCLGRPRSPAATSAFHVGRPPRNRGLRYPADPPPVEEIVAVMRAAGPDVYGDRLRAIIVVLWRAGLRVGEALALAETDLDPARGAVLVRAGKNGKRREVGLDAWGWRTLDPWIEYRRQLPVGPLFCVLHGPSRGRPWSPAAVRRELRRAGARAGIRRAGSRLISFGIPTPWRWRMRGSQWWSSSASSGMPISASRASICRGLTTRRSFTPCITDRRRSSPPAPACVPRDRVTA